MLNRRIITICAGMIFAAGILTACSRTTAPETITPKETEVQTTAVPEQKEKPSEEVMSEAGADTVKMEAYIQVIDGNDLILADQNGGLYQLDKEMVEIQEELHPGLALDIVYSGILMRNIPAAIPQVESITVAADREDPYGFYRTLLQKIWDTKPELNEGIEFVALDFSDADNMEEYQKYVLEYVMRHIAQCDVRVASEDQLKQEGMLSDEKDSFVDVKGMLISIDDEKRTDDQITFDAEKWVSDTSEAEWDDQTARYENGSWVMDEL